MDRKSLLLGFISARPFSSTTEIADAMPWPRVSTRVYLHELSRDGVIRAWSDDVKDDGRGSGSRRWEVPR